MKAQRIELPKAGLVERLESGRYLWAYRDGDRIVCGDADTAEAANAAMARSRAERALWAIVKKPDKPDGAPPKKGTGS